MSTDSPYNKMRQEVLKEYFNEISDVFRKKMASAVLANSDKVIVACEDVDGVDVSKMVIKSTDSAFIELKEEIIEQGEGVVSDVTCKSSTSSNRAEIAIYLKKGGIKMLS